MPGLREDGTVFDGTLSVDDNSVVYGTGVDGDVTISSNTSLARDTFYNNLWITTGSLATRGFRLFCKTALYVSAGCWIQADGPSAPATDQGGGQWTATGSVGIVNGFVGGFGNGGNGGAGGRGGDGANAYPCSLGGNGGMGGKSDQASGSGGKCTRPTGLDGGFHFMPAVLWGLTLTTSGTTAQPNQFFIGGAGGGGGSAKGGVGNGGGGGTGGGVMVIAAKSIVNYGSIRAAGGTGRLSGSTGGGAGGGGGGGGVVFAIYNTYSGSGLITAPGGSGSLNLGTTSATSGTNGDAGVVIERDFTPKAIPNLVAWYKMTADNITLSGGKVLWLQDLSGHGYHLTASTSNQAPLWVADDGVTVSSLNFDGTRIMSSSTAALGIAGIGLAHTSGAEVFAVYKPLGGQGVLLEYASASSFMSAAGGFEISVGPNFAITASHSGVVGLSNWYTNPLTASVFQVCNFTFDKSLSSGESHGRVNGRQDGAVGNSDKNNTDMFGTPLGNPQYFYLGGVQGGASNSFLSGNVAELIVYGRALQADERSAVERYLSKRTRSTNYNQ